MTMAMGAPVVRSSNTPERSSARSDSRRALVTPLCPGRRRSRSRWTSSTDSARPGGTPSTTTPTAAPWLSPKVETVRNSPKELPGMGSALAAGEAGAGRPGPLLRVGQSDRDAVLLRRGVQVAQRDRPPRAAAAAAGVGDADVGDRGTDDEQLPVGGPGRGVQAPREEHRQ